MDNRDQLICEAFYEIFSTPITELENKLGKGKQLTIATYLDQIPLEERYDYEMMARRIGNFCYQPGNEILIEWLKDIYETQAGEDLTMGMEEKKSPNRKAVSPRKDDGMIENKSRVLRDINDQKNSVLTQQNSENNANERP